MVGVLNGLMRHKCTTPEDNGIRVPDLVKQPDLPQARVNKCLIALVQKKSVVKWTENVCVKILKRLFKVINNLGSCLLSITIGCA